MNRMASLQTGGGDSDLVSFAEATRVQAVVDDLLGVDAD